MILDYFLYIAENREIRENTDMPYAFAMGRVDELSLRFFKNYSKRNRIRQQYIKGSRWWTIPNEIQQLLPDFSSLPSAHWIGLEVEFELLTPWYSRDDRVFHLMDNPVRKDRILGIPFMAATSWKGLLRWACRMQEGLLEHFEAGKQFNEWKDPDWIIHLFGNEKGEKENFCQGALLFYPTWFDKIGFEVINPHNRERRAGTQPIYYEVVPGRGPQGSGGKGSLYLLYAPWPGMKHHVNPQKALPKLFEAIETLLTTYGISAKRTVGWGTAEIKKWKAYHRAHTTDKDSWEKLWDEVQGWFYGGRS